MNGNFIVIAEKVQKEQENLVSVKCRTELYVINTKALAFFDIKDTVHSSTVLCTKMCVLSCFFKSKALTSEFSFIFPLF